MKTERCRSCKAIVIWATLPSGKRAPFNASQVPARIGGAGYVLRQVEGGDVQAELFDADPSRLEGSGVHLSHFATCPDCIGWRKS